MLSFVSQLLTALLCNFVADLGSYIIRTCKTDVSIDMYLSPDMCLDESRPGSGHMCTCPEERCNSAMPSLSTSHITLLIPTLCWIVKFFK
ncbi:hypothetical protein EB796_002812 [Bugula neritina]|uniref:Uncharacterized protein n=1 Tax=Bugula neritina TaxID=10212 RepID=A0A7J7KLT3_BUGNE|nr:hypothetical protein EB796_002812 [Bugula neritina]